MSSSSKRIIHGLQGQDDDDGIAVVSRHRFDEPRATQRRPAGSAAGEPRPLVRFLSGRINSLLDVMLRSNDDRAQRNVVGVPRAPIVHGDAEKARDSIRFTIGSNLLDGSPERLFSLIDTGHDLEARRFDTAGKMQGHGIQCLDAEAGLVRKMVDAPLFEVGEGVDFLE